MTIFCTVRSCPVKHMPTTLSLVSLLQHALTTKNTGPLLSRGPKVLSLISMLFSSTPCKAKDIRFLIVSTESHSARSTKGTPIAFSTGSPVSSAALEFHPFMLPEASTATMGTLAVSIRRTISFVRIRSSSTF
uniref:Phytochrome C n=1 Tax=Rhizophora mucronata TaxID=61149 RepID=A0A2P2J8X6_RHIMU